jgi:hypothetical protein
MDINKIGEPVRNNYRNQGAKIMREHLVEALNKDAIVSLFVPAWVLEHIVRIVEETK